MKRDDPPTKQVENATRHKTLEQGVQDLVSAQSSNEEQFHALVEQLNDISPTIVLILDPEGNIVHFNPFMEHLCGYTLADVQGKNWFDTFIPERDREHVRALFGSILKEQRAEAQGNINSVLTKTGEECLVEWHDSLLKEQDGNLTSILSVGVDVTEKIHSEQERRRIEAQLRRNQKLEAIGTLAGGVAHEISNPIMGIMGYAQLIADDAEEGSSFRKCAEEIIVETNRVSALIKNLLSFARREKQSQSPARLCDIVDQTLSLLRTVLREDRITLEVDVPEDLPKIKCRHQQLQQVVMNLATNARDALNEAFEKDDANKRMRITASVIGHDGHPWIRLSVYNTGPAIPDEIRAQMFDPFFTTKPRTERTGLGLAISYGIIQDHHGTITVESKEGAGTRFDVELPAMTAADEQDDAEYRCESDSPNKDAQ